MTRHALVTAAFLLLCGCSIGDPIQLSSCETSNPGPRCPPKETCAGQCVVVPPFALGGKKVTMLSYQPGTCQPMGGEPIDSVELKEPSTFCCQE